MRSICRRVPVALAAVFALSAMVASSAFAAPAWFAKTGGNYNKLVGALEVKTTTNLTVTDTHWGGEGTKVSCEVTVKGTIEAGGLGKINNYEANASSCKPNGSCAKITSVEAVHLPWKTELYSEEGQIRERLVSGGSGTPSWQFSCETLGVHQADLCNFDTSTSMLNEVSGSVQAEFDAKSNLTTCSIGGGKVGKLEGKVTFAHPTGVEAIEVAEVTPGEWKQGGLAISTSVATVWKGVIKFRPTAGRMVECNDSGEGSVAPSGMGTEMTWTTSGCVTREGQCGSPAVVAEDLPWNTELAAWTKVLHDVMTEDGKGVPGYSVKCTIFGIRAIYGCTATALNTAVSNAAGGVNATFDGESLKCRLVSSHEPFESGSVEGTQLIEATKGGKLEVT